MCKCSSAGALEAQCPGLLSVVVQDLQEAHQDLASLKQASQAGEEAIVAQQMLPLPVAMASSLSKQSGTPGH